MEPVASVRTRRSRSQASPERDPSSRGSPPKIRKIHGWLSAAPSNPVRAVARVRLQLVLGDDRAEVSLNNLERLENRSLCEELGVILRALTVVAATRILGWKMTDRAPTPAAGCCGIGVDSGCHLVVATVAHVAKAVEMSVLRLDEPEPRVPKRVGPVQGLEQRRVDLPRVVCSDSRLLTKTLDSVHVTANKPGTRCSAEHTHLSRRRSFWTRPGP